MRYALPQKRLGIGYDSARPNHTFSANSKILPEPSLSDPSLVRFLLSISSDKQFDSWQAIRLEPCSEVHTNTTTTFKQAAFSVNTRVPKITLVCVEPASAYTGVFARHQQYILP